MAKRIFALAFAVVVAFAGSVSFGQQLDAGDTLDLPASTSEKLDVKIEAPAPTNETETIVEAPKTTAQNLAYELQYCRQVMTSLTVQLESTETAIEKTRLSLRDTAPKGILEATSVVEKKYMTLLGRQESLSRESEFAKANMEKLASIEASLAAASADSNLGTLILSSLGTDDTETFAPYNCR